MSQDNKPGQEMVVYYSLEAQRTTTPTTTYLLGGVNNKGPVGKTKESIDVTTGYHKERILGSASDDGTISGFYSVGAGDNHKTLMDYIEDNTQSIGWVGKQYPVNGGDEIKWIPCVFLSCPITATTDEAITFELTYESDGATIREAV